MCENFPILYICFEICIKCAREGIFFEIAMKSEIRHFILTFEKYKKKKTIKKRSIHSTCFWNLGN